MSACCENQPVFTGDDPAFRRVLWTVISINFSMFVIELGAGLHAGSQALQADALDFLGDSATYGLSLWVINKPAHWRAKAAIFKGISLAVLAMWVLGSTLWRVFVSGVPEAAVMGAIGFLALAANIVCLLILMKYREGDANVRSIWLCSRNDVIGNIAVVLAASGVFALDSAWPDLFAAFAMASLFLWSSAKIIGQALSEKRVHAAG